MEHTLALVKNLERFVKKHGDDEFVSHTIFKLVNYKIQKYEEEIRRLDIAIRRFEHTHHKESSAFLMEFKAGVLGDDADLIEWYSLCRIREDILGKKEELEGVK